MPRTPNNNAFSLLTLSKLSLRSSVHVATFILLLYMCSDSVFYSLLRLYIALTLLIKY